MVPIYFIHQNYNAFIDIFLRLVNINAAGAWSWPLTFI